MINLMQKCIIGEETVIKKLGVQAHSFKQYYCDKNATLESLTETFKEIKAMGYDQLQSAYYGKFTHGEYMKAVKNAGLELIGTHYEFLKIRDNTDDTMKLHEELFGTKLIGIGSMPLNYRESPEGVEKFIEEVNAFVKVLSSAGFRFTYHHHHFEFVPFHDGRRMMDMLVEGFAPEVLFCLDTHWLQRGGACPVSWIEKLSGRIPVLHLKDMGVYKNGGPLDIFPKITPVGEGNIDFDAVLAAAERAGVEYYCVEYDVADDPDPLDALRKSSEYIHKHYMK